MPLGASKAALIGMGGAGGGNYFGDGSDGAVTTSGDVTYTVANKSGSYDGDMVVKNYSSLTISSGDTITTDQPCRGMLIYVKGNCTIAGTLSARIGAFADPTNTGGSDSAAVNASGIRLPMLTASGSDTLAAADFAGCGNVAVAAVANQPGVDSDGTVFQMVKTGAAGAPAHTAQGPTNTYSNSPGQVGGAGTTTAKSGQCGGGGNAGLNFYNGNSAGTKVTGQPGGLGGAFSGGSGSGATALRISSSPGYNNVRPTIPDYGGGASDGSSNWQNCFSASGGAGNPAGNNSGDNANTASDSKCGGILWLVVGGDVSVTGTVTAAGGNTGAVNTGCSAAASGGGSGGGVVMILHAGTYSNSGTVTAAGGTAGNGANADGADGGAGAVVVAQVS